MFLSAITLAALSSSVIASPIRARQAESSVVEVTSLVTSASVATSTVSVEPTTSAVETSVATTTVTATSSAASVTATGYGFSCPNGGLLTYAINRTSYDVPIQVAYNLLSNWSTAVPPPGQSVNSSGTGDIGATRTWSYQGLNISEQLTNVTTNATTGFLKQEWITTAPLVIPQLNNLTIFNATESLTLYSNSSTNATTAQYFINFCASDQETGRQTIQTLINTALSGFGQLATQAAANATSSASSAVASATSSSASVASSAAASVSSAQASITSSAESVVSSIAASASGILSALSSAVAGA